MAVWIIPANKKYYLHDLAFKVFGYIDWVQSPGFKQGDLVFVYMTGPILAVRYLCHITKTHISLNSKTNDDFCWPSGKQPSFKSGELFSRITLDETNFHPNLSYGQLRKNNILKGPLKSPKILSEVDCNLLLTYFGKNAEVPNGIQENDETIYCEGKRTTVLANRYERNRALRKKCIGHYGCFCQICGFDFGKFYGDFAEGFIEVHHIVPLGIKREKHKIDPISDLIPVCSNCHSVLHMKKNGLNIAAKQLKENIKKR